MAVTFEELMTEVDKYRALQNFNERIDFLPK